MRLFITALLSFAAISSVSNAAMATSKLFDEPGKPLAITLTADFSLINTRNQTGPEIGRTDLGYGMIDAKYFSSQGTLTYKNEAGQDVQLAVAIEPRGMRRRRDCDYKPLNIDLAQKPTDELFAGTSTSIEMITHCSTSRINDIYLEYFAYRLKSAFIAPAFRVRMAKFTYVDTKGVLPTVTYDGFFMEPKKDMAHRFDAKVLRLTPQEEAVPLTSSEQNQASWARMYGDSFVPRIAMRQRIYAKYLKLSPLVALSLREIMHEKLGTELVSNSDVTQESLVNVFPIQYKSGAVQMVEYDFDSVYIAAPSAANFLYEVFSEYARGLKLGSIADYKAKRTPAEKQADQAEVIAGSREILAAYQASGFDAEAAAFTNPGYDTTQARTSAATAVTELTNIINDPANAFAFLN